MSATANAGNSANSLVDSLTDYAQFISTRAVTDTGGTTGFDYVGANVNAATRYAGVLVADAGAFTSRTLNATADYSITFTVNVADPGTIYTLQINTARLGATTTVEDSGTSNQAAASMGAVTGQYNAVTNASLGLAAVTTSSGGSDNDVFNQAGVLTLTGLTGSQTITLRFTWAMGADSTCTGIGCNVAGVDEAAVRLGIAGTGSGTPGTSADDYPGVGSRTIGNDGHFVTILANVTYVPEPGTALLFGLGLSGLAFARRRRA